VAAYKDLLKLTWSNTVGLSQSRDYEFDMRYGVVVDPPIGIPDFDNRIRHAQAIQCLFIAAGTQARDMSRDGVRVTEGINGARTTFTGYRGPVCGEAIESLSPYLELMPRLKRF
jgi:hypothetical protein